MNFLKRAGLSLWSHRARTLITAGTFLVISVMVLGGILIQSATARAARQAKEKVGAQVKVELDMAKLAKSGNFSGSLGAGQTLSTKVADRLGRSPLVQRYTYDLDSAAYPGKGLQLSGGKGTPAPDGSPPFLTVHAVLDSSQMYEFAGGKYTLLSGKPLGPADRDRQVVLIEERLAKRNHLRAGDRIDLASTDPGAKGGKQFTVQGVYRDPDASDSSSPTGDPGDSMVASIGGMGALNAGDRIDGGERINDTDFTIKDPHDIGAFRTQAKKAGLNLDVFTFDLDQSAYTQMTGPLSSVTSSAKVAMWLISVAGAAVLGLLVALAVKQRRREYGVLLGMGERKWKLIAQHAAEIIAVACLALGLSALFVPGLTQRAGNALLRHEAGSAQKKIDAYRPPAQSNRAGPTGDADQPPVAGADPIDSIGIHLDSSALAEVAGVGLGISLLATVLPAASVVRLSPRAILTKGK